MPDPSPPRRAARRAARSGGLVTWCAVLAATAAAAGASSSTGTLRARAAVVAARISADDSALNALGETYLQERALLSSAQAAMTLLGAKVRSLNGAIAAEKKTAAAAATAAYVDAGSSTAVGLYLQADPDSIVIGETYLGYIEGRLRDAVAAMRRDEASRRAGLAEESAEASRAAAALAGAAQARRAVLSTLVSQQHLLASLRGQIAKLVAEELAAAAAAAARAAAARAAALANGPPGGTVTTSTFPTGTLAEDFAALRNCESGGNYRDDTGNGYYGAYQFSAGTWTGLGQSGLASQASPAVQDAAAYALYSRDGWAPWPACAAIIGL